MVQVWTEAQLTTAVRNLQIQNSALVRGIRYAINNTSDANVSAALTTILDTINAAPGA